MCEFKIVRKNDGSQIMEDIVIINYTEDNEIVFKDVLGMAEIVKSALILDVNTMNQTLIIVEHPIIKNFIGLMRNLTDKNKTKEMIEDIISQLNALKKSL
ncbi:MAG: CooT family nickel-binding protein [Promethearchaeota archaeon]